MSRLKKLITEVHRRSLWQVLLIYVGGAWVCYEIIDTITDRLALPEWLPVLAIILFLIGLPVVLATAFVHEVAPPTVKPAEPAPLTEAEAARLEAETVAARLEARRRHRFLTWRNAGLMLVFVLALWGVVAAGWLVFGGGEGETRAAADVRPSVAVLPFANRSGLQEDEYFTDGIHDEILTRLSKLSGLRVISRQSVMRFRDSPMTMGEIAEALRVRYVMEGGLLRARDDVRINVQLIDAHTDDHLWAETYDRPLSIDNLLDIQSEIASRIAAELEAVLTPEERRRVAARPTDNLEAYEHYLRGRLFSHEHTPRGWRSGIASFERAIDLDSTFALAYVGLAYCHRELARIASATAAEGYEQAVNALTKAIGLDETLGEAYAAVGSIKFLADWDMSGPESYFQRAIELSPGIADVYLLYAQYLIWLGRVDESIQMAARAVELDPLGPLVNAWLAAAYFWGTRYDESIDQCKRLLELNPGYVWGHAFLANNYVMKGMYAAAVAHADTVQAISRSTGNPVLVAWVGPHYGRAGEREKAEKILDEILDLHAQGSIGATAVALNYAGLGERDLAFEWLRIAVQERGGNVVFLKAMGETYLRDLRSDPRYEELLKLVGFEDH